MNDRNEKPIQNEKKPVNMGFIDDFSYQNIHNRSTDRKTEGKPVYSNPLENENKPKRKITKMSRKRYRKQNTSLVLICTVLAALFLVSLAVIIFKPELNEIEPVSPDNEKTGLNVPSESDGASDFDVELSPDSEEETDSESQSFITVSSKDIHKGNLILVNYKYEYVFPEEDVLVSMYKKSPYFSVNATETLFQQEALDSFCTLMEDLYENSGCDDVIVVSAFRSVEKQAEIYQDRLDRYGSEYAASYVADPGYSEHHTGLALDLSVYADDGRTYDIESYEDCAWFMKNYTEYGYILRYPADKASITSINFESWHYRYVSLPHSIIMKDLNLCLEEYVDYLKDYTYDTKILSYNKVTGEINFVTSDQETSGVYLIYYVPVSEDETTKIPVIENKEYSVSGNNTDGFIITVKP